jgi:hypothetical protein
MSCRLHSLQPMRSERRPRWEARSAPSLYRRLVNEPLTGHHRDMEERWKRQDADTPCRRRLPGRGPSSPQEPAVRE